MVSLKEKGFLTETLCFDLTVWGLFSDNFNDPNLCIRIDFHKINAF